MVRFALYKQYTFFISCNELLWLLRYLVKLKLEPANLTALCAKNILVCFLPHVPACFACLPTQGQSCFACSRANRPWVLTSLTCQHAFHVYVLMCQHALQAYALTCQHSLNRLSHLTCVNMWLLASMPCLLSK